MAPSHYGTCPLLPLGRTTLCILFNPHSAGKRSGRELWDRRDRANDSKGSRLVYALRMHLPNRQSLRLGTSTSITNIGGLLISLLLI